MNTSLGFGDYVFFVFTNLICIGCLIAYGFVMNARGYARTVIRTLFSVAVVFAIIRMAQHTSVLGKHNAPIGWYLVPLFTLFVCTGLARFLWEKIPGTKLKVYRQKYDTTPTYFSRFMQEWAKTGTKTPSVAPPTGEARMHLNKDWSPKVSYSSMSAAQEVAARQGLQEGSILNAYQCDVCHLYHVGHQRNLLMPVDLGYKMACGAL
jgi:hypothetical protein